MSAWALVIVLGALVASYATVGAVRSIAIRKNLLDVPNERSSHCVATPRGGGLGIVIAFTAAVTGLWALGLVAGTVWLALVPSSVAIAFVGYLDDRYHLGARSRLVVHIGAATLFVVMAGGFPADELLRWGLRGVWLGSAFSILAAVWSTNLFNFMDGIDGIAASEAIFMTASGGALILLFSTDVADAAMLFSLSAACVGFVLWNWPPARIFMGDVGSGFLGFAICACLMIATTRGGLPIEVLPILGAVFIVDATITLIRRMLQGDRWLEPHRTHAYQHLARGCGSHRPVTIGVNLINLFWLLPWAMAVVFWPFRAPIFLIAALLPLVILSILVGSGRRERQRVR